MTKRPHDSDRNDSRRRTDRVRGETSGRASTPTPPFKNKAVLQQIVDQRMHRIRATRDENRAVAKQVFEQAENYRRVAAHARDDGLTQQAVSNIHEASRLAVTAVATRDGVRFRDAPGAHKAVIDVGNARGVVTDREHLLLHELSDLRNSAMYPADVIEPSDRELDGFEAVVDSVFERCRAIIDPPRKIPPPPR